MHECCLQHLSMSAARTKDDRDKKGKQRRENLKRSTAGRKFKKFDGVAIAWAYCPPGV